MAHSIAGFHDGVHGVWNVQQAYAQARAGLREMLDCGLGLLTLVRAFLSNGDDARCRQNVATKVRLRVLRTKAAG